jgi:hypothetical protein
MDLLILKKFFIKRTKTCFGLKQVFAGIRLRCINNTKFKSLAERKAKS